jgi:hypothetical protein
MTVAEQMVRPKGTGVVQNAIVEYLKGRDAVSISEIIEGVTERLGTVSASSVRSSLNLNVGTLFERTGRGKYRLKPKKRV